MAGIGSICAIYGCSNYRGPCASKSFYRFPKNKDICKQWVVWSRRADLDDIFKRHGPEHLNKSYVVCSDHFVQKDFRNKNLLSQGLWPGSIPSVLPSAKDISPRRTPKKRKREEELESETTVGGESEVEIKCDIEERSFEFDEPWRSSGVECSSAFYLASEVKSEPQSDDEGRNSDGDVAITPATAPNRTLFAEIFVKEEPQSCENELEIPVTNELNVIEVKSEPVEATIKEEVVETMVAADT